MNVMPRCQGCGAEMKIFEYEAQWGFACKPCNRARVIDKVKIGGTQGSGMKADGCRTVVGRGL